MSESLRPLALAGVVSVTGNIFGVVALSHVPSAYRVGHLDSWIAEIADHPHATTVSAVAFTIAFIGMTIWAIELRPRLSSATARVGAICIACGTLVNAAGTLTPMVLALYVLPDSSDLIGRALLGFTLALDALFNLAFGIGLLLISIGGVNARRPWMRWLSLSAGLGSLAVSAEAIYEPASDVLSVSAPLWLGFIMLTSFDAWRKNV